MVKPWGSIGAWAEESERAEEEAKQRAAFPVADEEAFPTLGEAVTTAAKQGKKKKPQTVHVSQLVAGTYVGPGGRSRQSADSRSLTDSRGLTPEEMMMLPRGPRERSAEEGEYGGLGGGFRDYGGFRGGVTERGGRDQGGRDQDRSSGFGGGFDRDRDAGGYGRDRDRDRDESVMSRADESGDWGASRKFVPSQSGRGYDDDRRGMSDRELPSKADEVDNWSSAKKFVPSQGSDWKAPGARSDGRRGGFDEGAGGRNISRADEVESWGAGKKVVSGERGAGDLGYNDGGADADRWARKLPPLDESRPFERRPLVLLPRSQNIDTFVPSAALSKETSTGEGSQIYASSVTASDQPPKPRSRPNPFGAARPREEVLAEKGQDWRKLEAGLENREREIRNSRPSTPDVAAQRWPRPPLKSEAYGQGREDSRPSSSHSSRPQTPEMPAQVGAKPRPKINPFGDAKPREVLLEEKGKDWRKIDLELEHRSVERPDTEEEMSLKKEIKLLEELLNNKIEFQSEKNMYGILCDEAERESGIKLSVREQLIQKEKQLENLTIALDDKIRYSQRSIDRPPSRGGRSDSGRGIDALRPSSTAGSTDSARGIESRSRETKGVDIWTRPTAETDVDQPPSFRDHDRRRFDRW